MRQSPKLDVVLVPIEKIVPFANNPREHPPEQVAAIVNSITHFGFTNPVLLNSEYEVVAGHGRVLAAPIAGLDEVPCIILNHLTEAEQRAYRIADNALQARSRWTPDLLATEVAFVLESDLDFSVEDLGFEVPELDFILSSSDKRTTQPGERKAEEIEEPDRSIAPVSRVGDIWSLGSHRVACGDGCDSAVYLALMADELAEAVISDPPWNLASRMFSGKGKYKFGDFVMAAGEMSREEFRAFLRKMFECQARFCLPGALVMNFIDWRSVADMIWAGEPIFDRLENICVWAKTGGGGMGGIWRSRHELIVVFRGKGGKARNNVQLGKHGRNRSNIWEYPSPSVFGSQRENLKFHPTGKNLEMIADAILDCTKRGSIVLDPFLGSGTAILAAAKTGRIGRGIELDPSYVDVAVKRISEALGRPAIHQDGRTFDEVRTDREIGEE
ncbi:DNA modification methylase [Sphingobium xanthum]|jgi:DNA modification methylase|uniref:site-specific DNA-methyltransferase n=1 Tax=Sphingobium xanthum TaxID=1387165 RepID=UPI001C8B7624|nr:DNA methyltransferase [Sphingobium xanthum]